MPGTATLAEGAVDAGDLGASPPTATWSFCILSILASSNKLNCTMVIYIYIFMHGHCISHDDEGPESVHPMSFGSPMSASAEDGALCPTYL